MYEAFYGLTEKPFSILPDPAYLYFGEQHSLAYTMLEYGLEHRAGFTVVTGNVGCGKSTLVRHLFNNFEQDINIGVISHTHREIGELLKWVLLSFEQPYEARDKVALFDQLRRFLSHEYKRGRRSALIIDEAQNLSAETLEELRMLSNINSETGQLLQLVLVGQPQLKELLRHPDMEQFSQRVSVDFHIDPLPAAEVGSYINHRLAVAGRDEPVFDDAAILRISHVTEGTPRKINILCDTALVYGYSLDASLITVDIIEQVMKDKERYGVFGPALEESQPTAVQPRPNRSIQLAVSDEEIARQLFPSLSRKKNNT